jgi:hypothetical protein
VINTRTYRVEGETVTPLFGTILTNVHQEWDCAGWPCVIHRPSHHAMRSWSLHWRDDRRIFERICKHGVGHPDPDQIDHWRAKAQLHNLVHGCDGCCANRGNGNGE